MSEEKQSGGRKEGPQSGGGAANVESEKESKRRAKEEQKEARRRAEEELRKQIQRQKEDEAKRNAEEKRRQDEARKAEESARKQKEEETRAAVKPPSKGILGFLGGEGRGLNSQIKYPKIGRPLPPDWTVLERYPLFSGFVYAIIAENPSGESRTYFLDEVPLSETEARIYTYLLEALEHELIVPRRSVDATKYFAHQARKLARKYSVHVERLQWAKILYFTERDVVGFGQLDGLMRDSQIEDISVDGMTKPAFIYHGRYERLPTNISFESMEDVNELIGRFAHISGRHVSTAYPIVQGTLPGGHRMMGTYMTEVSPHGGTLSIRRFRADPITIVDMLNSGVLDHRLAAYTWLLMENNATAMVVGATGSGKTTTLNALLTMTRTNTKIITIEEVQEVNLAHPNWTPFVSRERFGTTEEGPGEIGLFDLVKAAMRMRPDIIVVGEVRGEEAYVLFQAISTGHGGLCTLHADDAASAIQRLVSKPMDVPPAFISFLDLVFTVRRVSLPGHDGTSKAGRRILSVDEIAGVDQYNRMFTWDAAHDIQVAGNLKSSNKLQKVAKDLNVSIDEIVAEVDRRATVLKWLQEKGIRNFRDITPIFEGYRKDPRAMHRTAVEELRAISQATEVKVGTT